MNDPLNPHFNPNDPEWQEIEALKARDDFKALGEKIQSLMKLPQSLCKVRGNCCRIATFKGSLSYDELMAMAQSDDPDAQNAKDFATLFIPYSSQDEVRAIANEFVDRVRATADHGDPDKITFYHCRFLADDGRCQVHEDRPTGCRAYPFPHAKTVYHPGCGFEERGTAQWQKVDNITQYFERRLKELSP